MLRMLSGAIPSTWALALARMQLVSKVEDTHDTADVLSPPRRARPTCIRIAVVHLVPPRHRAAGGRLPAVRRMVLADAATHQLHFFHSLLLTQCTQLPETPLKHAPAIHCAVHSHVVDARSILTVHIQNSTFISYNCNSLPEER